MTRLLVFAALLAGASPAFAQKAGPLPDPNDRSDTFSVGVGGAYIPDYEGSDDNEFTPYGAIRGRVSGFEFYMRDTYLYVDFLRQPTSGVDFDFGPIVGARFNRTGKVDDDFVDALPERDVAFELGAFAGISLHGLTNPYDELSFRLDFKHDVGGAHGSSIVSPNIDFGTPVSRFTYVGASAGMDFVGDGFADYYYSISPADSIASLLPVYEAEGGMKNWRLGAFIAQSITGDLTHGFSLFAGGNYSHLTGDIADSPIVDLRGQRSQWQFAAGVGYTW